MNTFSGYLKERDLARELGLSVWTLRAWRKRGYGPPFGKVGRTVVYRRLDVEHFLFESVAGDVA